MDNTHNPDISLVVPCHNEEGNVALFLEETIKVFGARDNLDYEVVFVNDGSADQTFPALRALVDGEKERLAAVFGAGEKE